MQPNRPPEEDWQQPSEQPSQAPYTTAQDVPEQPSEANVDPEAPLSPSEQPLVVEDSVEEEYDEEIGEEEPIHWQAAEYIHHEKNGLWFVVFGLVVAGLMALAIFLMNAITFAILIPVMAVALVIYSHRPPRILDYTLSRQGLHVNDHLYSFSEFKSFGVVRDGEEYSIMLIPIKRFRPGVSVYFPEEAGEDIVDMLGSRLPMQELHLDMVDQIIRKLRI